MCKSRDVECRSGGADGDELVVLVSRVKRIEYSELWSMKWQLSTYSGC